MTAAESLLYYGDNLDVLRRHVKDESVDLVYLDPPFNSQANYKVLFKAPSGQQSEAQIEAFDRAGVAAHGPRCGDVAEGLQRDAVERPLYHHLCGRLADPRGAGKSHRDDNRDALHSGASGTVGRSVTRERLLASRWHVPKSSATAVANA